ncbi:hypothetical protein FQN53_003044 [Emmonsiellopsis sp. PD_33]|nr:hypothetical protein FQN53_003044 [Emmonsiellopsis sp. PD_33]
MSSSPPPPTTPNPIITKIAANLTNTLSSFGPQSAQYAAVLDMLRDSIRELEQGAEAETSRDGTGSEDVIEALRGLLERGLRVR